MFRNISPLGGIQSPFPRSGSSTSNAAVTLLGDEWSGLALDFLSNAYAVRVVSGSELLLGSGPLSASTGMGIDFTDNSYAVGT